jgi:predicted Zn-ribbon and HTH transcriptional regulator
MTPQTKPLSWWTEPPTATQVSVTKELDRIFLFVKSQVCPYCGFQFKDILISPKTREITSCPKCDKSFID